MNDDPVMPRDLEDEDEVEPYDLAFAQISFQLERIADAQVLSALYEMRRQVDDDHAERERVRQAIDFVTNRLVVREVVDGRTRDETTELLNRVRSQTLRAVRAKAEGDQQDDGS